MKNFSFGRSTVSAEGPCYVIAEIGHNHQGDLEKAKKLIRVAAAMGAHAVKFQKRDNRSLFTKAMYNKPYDNPNSYGATYGEHREFLEFGLEETQELMRCAQAHDVEFMSTPFDVPSVDFLEGLGVTAYKMASGDLSNTPFLTYVAKLGKPMFVSTGAASLDEVRTSYEAMAKHNDRICLLHCTAAYPAEYDTLNLKAIVTMKREFPEAIIGYSGHDIGILAPAIAYMLGATVVEKHFTLNRAWKGTDHKFSLEPTGLHKMCRDLHRVDISLGDGDKQVQDFEWEAREKMGKSLYAARDLPVGAVVTEKDVLVKSPGGGIPPAEIETIVGRVLTVAVSEENPFSAEQFQAAKSA